MVPPIVLRTLSYDLKKCLDHDIGTGIPRMASGTVCKEVYGRRNILVRNPRLQAKFIEFAFEFGRADGSRCNRGIEMGNIFHADFSPRTSCDSVRLILTKFGQLILSAPILL